MKITIFVIGEYGPFEINKRNFEENFITVYLKSPSDLSGLENEVLNKVEGIALKADSPDGFSKEAMALLPNLRIIANFGVGYDAIDIVEANKRGIVISNTPDVLNDDVADLAIGMMISVCRQMSKGSTWIESRQWQKQGSMPLNRSISTLKCGILGLGRIGFEIAQRLIAFKSEIHYFSREKKFTPESWIYHSNPVELARNVDILFVSLIGGKDTTCFVSESVINALAPNGVIINISRGSTIDEDALIKALQTGNLGGAGLDVFLDEPCIDERFHSLKNVCLQPHQGSGTTSTRLAMADLQFENLLTFFCDGSAATPV